jgi:hypothetical protein
MLYYWEKVILKIMHIFNNAVFSYASFRENKAQWKLFLLNSDEDILETLGSAMLELKKEVQDRAIKLEFTSVRLIVQIMREDKHTQLRV